MFNYETIFVLEKANMICFSPKIGSERIILFRFFDLDGHFLNLSIFGLLSDFFKLRDQLIRKRPA